jgi:hypothetical protein
MHRGALEGALMEVELILRDFVSGREKNKITDWWHERINVEVRKYPFL